MLVSVNTNENRNFNVWYPYRELIDLYSNHFILLLIIEINIMAKLIYNFLTPIFDRNNNYNVNSLFLFKILYKKYTNVII